MQDQTAYDGLLLKLLVENLRGFCIVVLDVEGKVKVWNEGARYLSGYEVSEAVGKPFSAFFTREDQAAGVPEALLKRALQYGRDEDEGFRVRKDGGRIWLSGITVPLYDDQKRHRGFARIVRDLTEHRQIEELRRNETLVRELHHRIKNSLQLISALLELQAQKSGQEARETLQEAHRRVMAVNHVHDMLYRSNAWGRIVLNQYAESLVGGLSASLGLEARGISVGVDVQSVAISLDQATPLGLILNELLTNAAKHAFVGRTRGEIRVTGHRSGGTRYLLAVQDDGIGLPTRSPSEEPGVGMDLIGMLSDQINASFTLQAGARGGVRALVEFPLPEDAR